MFKGKVAFRHLLLGLGTLCIFGMPSCSKPKESKKKAPLYSTGDKVKSPILARAGKAVITEKEFLESYKAYLATKPKKKISAKVFLQEMLDELLILQDAEGKNIRELPIVKNTVRKALAQAVLKHDFHKWFTIKSVPEKIVKANYQQNRHRFEKPELIKVYHILVAIPDKPQGKGKNRPSAELLRLYKATMAERKILADKVLAELKQDPPKNRFAFEKAADRLKKKYNKLNPNLAELLPDLENAFKSKDVATLQATITKHKKRIRTIQLCKTCPYVISTLDSIEQYLNNKKKFVPQKHVDTTMKNLKKALERINNVVSMEKLPAFPKDQWRGYPNLVRPFITGGYSLKDKSFSQSLVPSSFGYHVIFRYETIPAVKSDYEAIFKDLRFKLYQANRLQRYVYWLSLRGKKYKFVEYPKRLEKVSIQSTL